MQLFKRRKKYRAISGAVCQLRLVSLKKKSLESERMYCADLLYCSSPKKVKHYIKTPMQLLREERIVNWEELEMHEKSNRLMLTFI